MLEIKQTIVEEFYILKYYNDLSLKIPNIAHYCNYMSSTLKTYASKPTAYHRFKSLFSDKEDKYFQLHDPLNKVLFDKHYSSKIRVNQAYYKLVNTVKFI